MTIISTFVVDLNHTAPVILKYRQRYLKIINSVSFELNE